MISDKDIVWIMCGIFFLLIIIAAYGNVGNKDNYTFTALGLIVLGILFVWFVLPLVI